MCHVKVFCKKIGPKTPQILDRTSKWGWCAVQAKPILSICCLSHQSNCLWALSCMPISKIVILKIWTSKVLPFFLSNHPLGVTDMFSFRSTTALNFLLSYHANCWECGFVKKYFFYSFSMNTKKVFVQVTYIKIHTLAV